ncbi:hypothetical protein AZL_a07080 (plasmid) [Azospirillum sp. B510]|uniref:hypothetical protein n=1 Tax=Azospirillum sp. (strain B510) TaxID=137722 RepID=UPI0001C4B9C0|nr:hypothetical protein [Azospirillum sp. B510]BAI74239.1 hypothetical protein AZL_a07080 [Azospirillum sp. B510]
MSATAKIVELRDSAPVADSMGDPSDTPQAAAIVGHIDALQGGRVFGWAWDGNHPGDRLEVELRLERDGGPPEILARVAADRPRPDLAGGGIGDGSHAFEAEVTLPSEADPSRVVAVVRSPSTGETTLFVQPHPEDQRLDRLLGPHLRRVGERIDAVRRDQRQLAAAQQAIGRLLREAGEGVTALRADTSRLEAAQGERMDALALSLHELSERVGGLEVFLMRMDQSLRGLDGASAERTGGPGWSPLLTVVGSTTGAFAAVLVGWLLLH